MMEFTYTKERLKRIIEAAYSQGIAHGKQDRENLEMMDQLAELEAARESEPVDLDEVQKEIETLESEYSDISTKMDSALKDILNHEDNDMHKTHRPPYDYGLIHLSSKKGEISATFDKLTSVFGEPTQQSYEFGEKSDCEWVIEWDDGMVGTIYNWKNGKSYMGEDGLEIQDITDWCIGGHQDTVVDRINNLLTAELSDQGFIDQIYQIAIGASESHRDYSREEVIAEIAKRSNQLYRLEKAVIELGFRKDCEREIGEEFNHG